MAEKVQFNLEFDMQASQPMLYQYISSSSGLSEWFARVSNKNNKYTFDWDGYEENATMIARRQDKMIRFRWDHDKDERYYFELRLEEDELTGDVSLIVTDFAEAPELEEAKKMWVLHINGLKKLIGA